MQEWMLSQLWQRIWFNMTGSMTGWVAAITANMGSWGSWPFPENLWEPKCSHVGSWQVSTYIFHKAVRVMHGCAVHQPDRTTKITKVPYLNKNSLFKYLHPQKCHLKWSHSSYCISLYIKWMLSAGFKAGFYEYITLLSKAAGTTGFCKSLWVRAPVLITEEQ